MFMFFRQEDIDKINAELRASVQNAVAELVPKPKPSPDYDLRFRFIAASEVMFRFSDDLINIVFAADGWMQNFVIRAEDAAQMIAGIQASLDRYDQLRGGKALG